MKFIKISLYILLGFVVVVLSGAGIFIATFDANDYKPLISEQIKQYTGRDFILEDIRPSVFPWLGIELQQLSLSNAKGFKAEKMLQMEQLDVKVALLPLLRQEVRVDTLSVHGLNVYLERNRQGITNWDDILQKLKSRQAETTAPARPEAQQTADRAFADPLAALFVNGVHVEDANINWDDAQSGQNISLQEINLSTGAIQPAKPLPVKLSALVKLAKPAASIKLETQTKIEFDLPTQQLNLIALKLSIETVLLQQGIQQIKLGLDTGLKADLKKQTFILPTYSLGVQVRGEAIPGGDIQVKFKGDANINLQKQTANIQQLNIETLGMSMQSRLSITELLDSPNAKGEFKLQEFSPQKLAKALAIELPETQAEKALQSASLSFDFAGDAHSVNINSLNINLDKSSIKGTVSVRDFAKPKINYSLNMGVINLDDYLPPAGKPVAVSKKNKGASSVSTKADIPIKLPLDLLRSLNVNGSLDISSLQVFAQSISNIEIKTRIKNGLINVPKLNARALQGKITSSAQLDVSKNTPRYQFKLTAKKLQAESVINPLLQNILGEKAVSMNGSANMTLDIKTRGQSVNQLTSRLNGRFKINLGNAKLNGVDAEYFVRKAVAGYLTEKKMAVPAAWRGEYKPKQTTALKMARASAIITNGEIKNKDLLLQASRFKVTGAGKINLPREKLDYRIVVDVKPTRTESAGERLLDIPMPIFVKGNFSQPDISIDSKVWLKSVGKGLRAEVKKEIKQAIKKEKKQQQKKIENKADEKMKDLKNKYRDKLKGLFR